MEALEEALEWEPREPELVQRISGDKNATFHAVVWISETSEQGWTEILPCTPRSPPLPSALGRPEPQLGSGATGRGEPFPSGSVLVENVGLN